MQPPAPPVTKLKALSVRGSAVLAALSVVTLSALATPLTAQAEMAASIQAPQAEAPGDRFEVFLLTMDQGDAVWEQFGHNALLVRDREVGRELVWNWGLFSFEAENFMLRFARGTMPFTMGPSELEPFVRSYASANRSVIANQLFLTQEEAATLDALIWDNFAPENRDYVYDYFRDNCSTRVRDILDRALGGLLQERFADVPTQTTYRSHVRRLVQRIWWLDLGLSYMLGTRADHPLSAWEAMFIPMEMAAFLEGFDRPEGPGGTRPLLGPAQVLYQADRATTPTAPPRPSLWWLVAGLAGGALLLVLGSEAARGSRTGVLGLRAGALLWWTISGALALPMVVVWLTQHEFGHWNLNLTYLSPLGLLLAPLALAGLVRRALWEGRLGRFVTRTALFIAGLVGLALLLQITSIVRQGNWEAVALGAPLSVGLALALVRAERDRSAEGSAQP